MSFKFFVSSQAAELEPSEVSFELVAGFAEEHNLKPANSKLISRKAG
jgi:hypothetical protein